MSERESFDNQDLDALTTFRFPTHIQRGLLEVQQITGKTEQELMIEAAQAAVDKYTYDLGSDTPTSV